MGHFRHEEMRAVRDLGDANPDPNHQLKDLKEVGSSHSLIQRSSRTLYRRVSVHS
jgi:hypothetical protein